MADLSDVQDALVSTIAGILYPNGTAQASVTGLPTIVYAGWPQSAQLDTDMAGFASGQGRIHVTVFATGTEKNTSRYFPDYVAPSAPVHTLSLTVSGQTVTVGGTVSTPQNLALLVNGQPYVYAVQAGDTPASIAAALAALVPGASSAGAVVTMPASARIGAARVGGASTTQRLTRTTQRQFQITVWADTPDHRTATAKAIDNALSSTEWLAFADGTGGRLTYAGSHVDDMVQKANLYRRDLMYLVEFSTVQSVTATEVVMTQENDSVLRPDGAAAQASTRYE